MPVRNPFLLSIFLVGIIAVLMTALSSVAFAVQIPGAADGARIKPPSLYSASPTPAPDVEAPTRPRGVMPKNANQVHLQLKAIKINGVTAFDLAVFQEFYQKFLGKDVTLDQVWGVADQITSYYHEKGFFLSRAYVPAQTVDNGVFVIDVAEGYISSIDMPEDLRDSRIIRKVMEEVTAERPVLQQTVESALLRLNDLPGGSFRSVLVPAEGVEAAAKISLLRLDRRPEITTQFNDYGSRYAGPLQATASYRGELLPMQETTLYTLTSIPVTRLRYGSIGQRIPLTFSTDLLLQASRSLSAPAYTLRSFDIRGDSVEASVEFRTSLLRQRQSNAYVSAAMEWRNASTNLLAAPLARDRIRMVHVGGHYDHADAWDGVNNYDVILTRGLRAFGAGSERDPNPSRAGAKPDFIKEEITFSRLQNMGHNTALMFSASAQLATGVMYASEEIGFGGQTYGRGYDTSEITGNDGVMAMVEMRYNGLPDRWGVHAQPFIFYDIGKVWKESEKLSAASSGLGVRLVSDLRVTADLMVAKPLTFPAGAPLAGGPHSKRYLFNLGYKW